jgi:cellulose synthase/poly-beta-1,6-N-acetylglucosamine synthase-like glycosyltransferase
MRISILIPCHNEERAIAACVESCLSQTQRADEIIVVNDGSTDRTAEILAGFGSKITVVTIPTATGNKSRAQEQGLLHITGDVFISTDADTILDPHFVESMMKDFEADETTVAVAGYVRSSRHNWLTALREIDYIIGQDLHKAAQAYMGSLFIIPGCAGAFRTSVFRQLLPFEHDTVTEDLDFTYRLHARGLKIVNSRRAIVYTQDPSTISDYANQMRRWYAGGWQNLRKHRLVLGRPATALQLSLVYIEGFFLSILLIIALFISPILIPFMILPQMFFSISFGTYGAISRRRMDLFYCAPLYPLLLFVNGYIFLEQFVTQVVLRREALAWLSPERRATPLTAFQNPLCNPLVD